MLYIVMGCTLLTSCANQPVHPTQTTPQKTRPPSADQRAQQYLTDHRYTDAAEAYLALAQGTSGLARQRYLLDAAHAYLLAEQWRATETTLAEVNASLLDPELRNFHATLRAFWHFAQNDLNKALEILATIPDPGPSPRFALLYRLQARAYSAAEQPLQAVQARVRLHPLLNEYQRADNIQAIWSSLLRINPQQLTTLTLAPPPDTLRGWIELLAVHRNAAADLPLELRLTQWQARFPNHPAISVASTLTQTSYRTGYPERIALLLPLSGRLATAAAVIRDGFMTGYYNLAESQQKPLVRVYDTSAEPHDVVAIYQRAVADGAQLIVGPLQKQSVAALLGHTNPQVPLLALNTLTQIDNTGELGFYRFGLAPEDEAEQVAERTIVDAGRHAIAIVPAGNWGDRMLQAFSNRFTQLGGMVLSEQRMQPNQHDFSPLLKTSLHLADSEQRLQSVRSIIGGKVQFEPRRRQDVDFIFLAAYPQQARLLSPQLHFHHALEMPVYATSQIYSGAPEPNADRDLDGILFCDIPWILSADLGTTQIRDTFATNWPEYARNYPRLFAFGIDAFELIPHLERLTLEPYNAFSGHTGLLSIDSQGKIYRNLLWAKFKQGIPVPIPHETKNPATYSTPAQAATSPQL